MNPTSPAIAWTRLIGGNSYDVVFGIATDAVNGAIYMAGTTTSDSLQGQQSLGNSDVFISRYNPDGTQAWTKLLGTTGDETSIAVTAGADGTIYVCGRTNGALDGQVNSGGFADAFLTAYSPDGAKKWTRLLGTNADDAATGLTIGIDGSIYVSGYAQGTPWWLSANEPATALNGQTNIGMSDAFISKYSTQGVLLWTRLLGSSANEYAGAITRGLDGAIYICGETAGPLDGQINQGRDAFLTKYTADGVKLWTQIIGTSELDYATCICTGLDGSIYLGGWTGGEMYGEANSGGQDAFLVKYSTDGVKLWARLWGGQGEDSNFTLLTGPDGAIYAGGHTKNGEFFDGFLTKFSTDGTKAWTKLLGTTGDTYAFASAAGVDGSIYVSGRTSGPLGGQVNSGGFSDAFLTKFSASPPLPKNYNTAAAENTTAIKTIAATNAALGTAPKYTLTGTDASLFKISTKGVLTFATAKDYEQPVDANKDGIYEVSVVMSNAKTGYKITQDLTVGVEFAAIQGTAAADTLKGTKGWDTLDGLAGDDKLTGDVGLDTFIISFGSDSITDFNNLGTGGGQEILQVSSSASVSATLKAAWTATSASFNNGAATLISSGMNIDLSAINQGQGWNLTNMGKTATLKGSMFNDVLTGGTATDYLSGGAGNDVLKGDKGVDNLTGGAGADTFRFSGGIGASNTDHITDFVSGVDKIQIDATLLTNETKGQISAAAFTVGKTATNAAQHFVYDNTTGNLWYDADGSGTKVKAVLIGVLDDHAPLNANDVWIV